MNTEKRSVWRILKGLPTLGDDWRCALGFHEWMKWSKPETTHRHTAFRNRSIYYQLRQCERCNVMKTRNFSL